MKFFKTFFKTKYNIGRAARTSPRPIMPDSDSKFEAAIKTLHQKSKNGFISKEDLKLAIEQLQG